MRHKYNHKHFNRTPSHKKAMFYNLSKNLIEYEKITTTLQKAKELRQTLKDAGFRSEFDLSDDSFGNKKPPRQPRRFKIKIQFYDPINSI